MWNLEVLKSHGKTSRKIPLRAGRMLLGREGCDIEIPDPRISAHHCWVQLENDQVEVMDNHSTNGTFINGARIQQAILAPGHILMIGNTELCLQKQDLTSESAQSVTDPAQISLSSKGFDFSIVKERKITFEDEDDDSNLSDAKRVELLNRRLQVLQRGVRTLNRAPSVPELLDQVMQLLFEAVNCNTGYILLVDPEDTEKTRAHLAYEKGKRKENLEDRLYSRTLVSKVLESKAGFIFDSEESGNSLMGGADQSLSIVQLRIKTALCCPIHSEGRVFGVVYLDNKKRGSKFVSDDLDLSMNVAGIAGMAIENIELIRKLRTEAMIRDNLKRFVSPNVAERIIAERGSGNFHLQSQKSQLSVLFVDIRGFTPLSEALSPLAVAQLLNAYFSQMCEIVFKNGGTLDKFIGDCMMVLFNAPVALPDHERIAVKTAVEMRQRLAKILPEWKRNGIPDFQVGFGINCGEAVVGSIGTESRMEYTAIGDTVNIASRVCGIAKPNQILITENIFEKVRNHFSTASLGATQLKGKSNQVLVYEVIDDVETTVSF